MSRGNEKKIEESRFILMSNTAVDLKKNGRKFRYKDINDFVVVLFPKVLSSVISNLL